MRRQANRTHIPVRKFRPAIACLVAFVFVSCLLGTNVSVQAVSVTISTDQALYPVWGLGGTVRVTAQNLALNVTYYLWSQNPKQITSNFTGLSLVSPNGVVPASLVLDISQRDPPGTYLLSLSRSPTSDTHEAAAHFGVLGTDSVTYERTETVTIAGGGFAPNSSIDLTINSDKGAYLGFPTNITAEANGGFEYHFKLSPSAETGRINATITGPTYDRRQPETAKSIFTVSSTLIRVQAFNQPVSQVERTLPVSASYLLSYPDNSPVTAVNSTANIVLGSQKLYSIPLILVNSTSGEWNATWTPSPSANSATYHFQFNPANFTDSYGNRGSGSLVASSDFKVIQAPLTFQAQIPATTQRTTSLNLTNIIRYPDGTALNSTATLKISAGNQTWTPSLNFDPTTGVWSASLYIIQNATTGPYNVTWTAKDPWGNAKNSTYTALVIPARFSFNVQANSTAAIALSNFDLPVIVRYPNGTSLTNDFGNVTGSYRNTTGYVFVLPLAYNDTNGTWHMFFFVPEQNNATLSFNATDRFGNSAVAMDVYNLKIAPVSKVVTRNLIIAGIVGVLVPIALLIWAFATISARRRKHRP